MKWRIAIAGLHMECASFLPHVTGREVFEANCVRGDAMIARYKGSNTVVGGFLATLAEAGAEAIPILHADGGAAGLADQSVIETYRAEIIDSLLSLPQEFDGILLHLHGAMVTRDEHDPDATTLNAIREAVGPHVPIMVALDYHGNLDEESIEAATAVFGYRFSPHVDMGETGARTADCLLMTLGGEITPAMAISRPGLILPSIFSATDLVPLRDLVRAARQPVVASGGYADVSLFAGFAYADVPNCGASVVAVVDGDRATAQGLADALAHEVSDRRAALSAPVPVYPLASGVQRALDRARSSARPVVLLEHADRANDSTYGLRALLNHTAKTRIAVPYLWDPVAVQAAMMAGEGAAVRLELGGRSASKAGGPVDVDAVVEQIRPDFRYRDMGKMRSGSEIRLGDTVLLDVAGMKISVTSLAHSAIDFDPFHQMGLDPADFDIVLLRSKTHFRAAWEPFASEIIIVDTPDYGPADLSMLPYRYARPGRH